MSSPVLPALSAGQSTSTSRQFIVYGADVPVRGALCELAEKTKRELLAVLSQRDSWTTPIVINARYPQANLPELPRLNIDVGQTGFGLKLQLEIAIDASVNRPAVRREILRALLLEMMYRAEPQLPAGTAYTSPPDWLLEGIPGEQLESSRDRVSTLLTLSAAKGGLPLEKFLEQRIELLDAAGRDLYRAYAFALVDLLSRGPDGMERLNRYVSGLPASSNDSLAELQRYFGEMFAPENIEKTWQTHIAQLSSTQPYQLLTNAETQQRLDALLHLKISEHGKVTTFDLAEFPALMKEKSARPALGALAHNLGVLATRAHPVYTPIIANYLEIIGQLLRGKTLSVPRRLTQLADLRKAIAGQMREIDDYMNWFEATNLAGPSGQFADYMEAAERAAQPVKMKRDAITVYLNSVETQFDR
jgi:hypothetical protein